MIFNCVKRFSILLGVYSLLPHLYAESFTDYAMPFMQEFCYKCHSEDEKVKGDIDLAEFTSPESIVKDREIWMDILEQVETEEMPTKKPLPTPQEREEFVTWLKDKLNEVDWSKVKYAGHVPMPLLTKQEYNNTMRDLLGVDVQPGSILFEDGEGHSGFTTDRSNLFISPAAMEKYFAAADLALDSMVNGGKSKKPVERVEPINLVIEGEKMLSTSASLRPAKISGGEGIRLVNGQTTVYEAIDVPADGEYKVTVRALSANADDGVAEVRIDNESVAKLTFPGKGLTDQNFKVNITKGGHQLTLNKGIPLTRKGDIFPKEVIVDRVTISGPTNIGSRKEVTKSKGKLLYTLKPHPRLPQEESARRILAHFLQRAFRRPVEGRVIQKYVNIFQTIKDSGEDYSTSLKQAMAAVLVSPRFLYRDELAKTSAGEKGEFALDDFQIASRLSYFLWSSMPDGELFKLAREGKLKDPEVLRGQVKRMLIDPKARAFTSSFLGQWLGFASLGSELVPDEKVFPEFNNQLSESMKLETILTFELFIERDYSLLYLLNAKATYLNEQLADLYGIPNVRGDKMRVVPLTDPNRGGLLGMGSILTATSTPTRTSPVLRGKWVMETLLGERIPEAPADVPEIDEKAGVSKNTTLREELEIHRDNPECARCHDKLDPIGFGLENFDAIGKFRIKERSGQKIDSSGELHGHKFEGLDELKEWLLAHRKKEFVNNLSERMLAFALGRKIETFDKAAIMKITTALEESEYKINTLIEEVVLSHPFLNQAPNNEIKINE